MAERKLYATRSFKYGTRMLKAGDAIPLDGPSARLYLALGAVSATKPKVIQTAPMEQAETQEQPTAAKPRRRRAATRRKKA